MSELAYDAPVTANRVLRQLIAIFRTALAQKSDEVTLGEEIVGIEPYLDIQRIRFADWLTIDYQGATTRRSTVCFPASFCNHSSRTRSAMGSADEARQVASRSPRRSSGNPHRSRDGQRRWTRWRAAVERPRDRTSRTCATGWRFCTAMTIASDSRAAKAAAPWQSSRFPFGAEIQNTAPLSLGTTNHATVLRDETELRVLRVPSLFRRPVIAITAIWFMCGLIWTQQSVMFQTLRHRLQRCMVLHRAARHDLGGYLGAAHSRSCWGWRTGIPSVDRASSFALIAYLIAGGVTTFVHAAGVAAHRIA